jgi:hypothetical protein
MKPERKAFFKKWLRRIAWLPLILLVLLAILEIFYRNQWMDTYKRELNALNPPTGPANPSKKVLAMGDSFTAAENSWVNVLRTRHPDWQIVNSAVPGTTIYQANLMLEGRLETFKPDLLIYQVYVGNDLFDLRYPQNWGEIGWGRNIYWGLANHVRSLAWLNYALGQFKRAASMPDFAQGKENQGAFDPAKYSERERLYLRAEPELIRNQVSLEGGREEDMEDYMELMKEFLATAREAGCRVLVLVVPHCAQVEPRYGERMRMIGAKGAEYGGEIGGAMYPFWRKLAELQGEGAGFVNLLPLLSEREGMGEAMYYLHDAHLNDAGQTMVANAVDFIETGKSPQ